MSNTGRTVLGPETSVGITEVRRTVRTKVSPRRGERFGVGRDRGEDLDSGLGSTGVVDWRWETIVPESRVLKILHRPPE